MVLQAFIDDSTTKGGSLILAGYLSSSQRWAEFSKDWGELLTIRPPWKRLKTREVMGAGPSDESLERCIHHYRLIENTVDISFSVVVPKKPLKRVVIDYDLPDFVADPYYLAWTSIVRSLSEWAVSFNVNEPIDFIFDEQSESRHILKSWDDFRASHVEDVQNVMENMPTFRSDDECLPLQASDLLAWWVGKRCDEFGNDGVNVYPFPWKSNRDIGNLGVDWQPKSVRKYAKRFKRTIISRTHTIYSLPLINYVIRDSN